MTESSPITRLRAALAGLTFNARDVSALQSAAMQAVEWMQDRCPSCEHSLSQFHREEGCWFTVVRGRPGTNLACPCDNGPKSAHPYRTENGHVE